MLEKEFKTKIFPLSICKDHNFQPFLNVFHFKGDNFDQKKLGKIFGIIKIRDHSENSAYIANIITQVFKKEFYKKYKSSTEENFEQALHKANLALADLSRCEIIEWIGNLDAIIGVIKNNILTFSYAGRGIAFLIREKKIVFIQDINHQQTNLNAHPIKTFAELSSGEINPEDKIIITTSDFLEKFPQRDLERHINSLTEDEFENLICSTLKSETDNIGLVIINAFLQEKPTLNQEEEKENEKEVNFFGNKIPPEKPKKEIIKKKEENKKDKEVSKEEPEKKDTEKGLKEKEKFFAPSSEIYMKEKDKEFDDYIKETQKKESANFFTEFLDKIVEKFKNIKQAMAKNENLEKIKNKSSQFKKIIAENKNWTALRSSARLIPYEKIKKITPSKEIIKGIPKKIRSMINIKNRNKKG